MNVRVQLEIFNTRNFELINRSFYVTYCLRFKKIFVCISDAKVYIKKLLFHQYITYHVYLDKKIHKLTCFSAQEVVIYILEANSSRLNAECGTHTSDPDHKK